MAKTTAGSQSHKSSGRPSQKPTRRLGGQRAIATSRKTVRTPYKPPSTTNYGTRPAQPSIPAEARANTGSKQVVNNQTRVQPVLRAGSSTPSVTPTVNVAAKRVAAPITRVPSTVNRAAVIAQNIAKQAANQQQHIAAVRTNMNHPTESGGGGGFNGGGGGGGGSGGGSGAAVVPAPAVTTPTTPVVSRPAPQVTSPAVAGAPSNVGTFTSRGNNMTAGRFNRQRLNRGPRTGMSITPEMLQQIAAQRIGPT